jgi:C4-dicarboxylate-specific signal transduction histidine kinase
VLEVGCGGKSDRGVPRVERAGEGSYSEPCKVRNRCSHVAGSRNVHTFGPTTKKGRDGMSTTVIILIVVAVIVVLAVVAFFARRQRARQLDQKRLEASEHREQADTRGRKAEQARLAAEEQADRARKEQTAAEEHRQQAEEIDPDVKE